jgi:acetate kinase
VAVFCYNARKWIGALSAALGGCDALVFTGGIGEHAATIREEICSDLSFLGIALESGRNARSEPVISRDGSRVLVRVIPTDEERIVAGHTARLIFGQRPG